MEKGFFHTSHVDEGVDRAAALKKLVAAVDFGEGFLEQWAEHFVFVDPIGAVEQLTTLIHWQVIVHNHIDPIAVVPYAEMKYARIIGLIERLLRRHHHVFVIVEIGDGSTRANQPT